MGLDSNKLKGLRTFHSDQQNLHSSKASTSAIEPTVKPLPKTPLSPVLTPRKPAPVVNTSQVTLGDNVTSKPKVEVLNEIQSNTKTGLDKNIINTLSTNKNPYTKSAPLLASTKKTRIDSGLQSKMDVLNQQVPKVATDRLSVMDSDSEITEGSIITDQKRERFKLLPSMVEAVKSWFALEKEALEDKAEAKRKAVPTVRSLDDRKKIIEQASKQSALAPKDDYKKLTAKIPTGHTGTATKKPEPLVIKKKTPESAPNWSHFEGELQQKPREETRLETPATKAPVPKIEGKPFIPTPPSTPVPAPSPVPKTPIKPVPTSVKTEPVQINIAPKAKPAPRYQSPPTKNASKNRIWVLVAGVIIAITAVGGGVTATFWFFQNNSSTPVMSQNSPEKALQVPVNYDDISYIALPSKRDELYAVLLEKTKSPSATLNLVIPTISAESQAVPAPTNKVMAVLNWQLNNTFIRSINEIYFGSSQSGPVIILKVSSFDNAFGGILSSEKDLNTELNPLFGEIVNGTFVVSSETESGVTYPHFVDETVKNHDVRVLKDELEKERIVYGFVNRNTIIITSTKDAFASVADKIR